MFKKIGMDLCSKPAIVSRQNRSIDVAGVIGGQKGNHRCGLFWPGRPSSRALHNCHHPRQSCLVGHATPQPNPRFDTVGQTALQRMPRSP
jgi:hypothetical protein